MLGRNGQAWHEQSSVLLRGRRLLAHGAMKECAGGRVDFADMGVPNGRVARPSRAERTKSLRRP
jgi:hypothetical protein